MPSYQICIVDDHPLICDAISLLFSTVDNFKPTLVADSVESALTIAQTQHIDVMLVDIHLPDGSGFSLAQRLKAAHPALKVVLISALHEQIVAGWSLQFGADGMVCKDAEPQMIIEIVKQALRGEPAFQPRAYRWLMDALRGDLTEGVSQLSPREMVVFCQIGQGHNSKEISVDLGISPRTVETYHRKIREKLCIPHHDALVRAATLFVGHGGGHQHIDREAHLLSQFEAATLPEEQWTHRAHLVIAFLYLSRFSFERGYKLISVGIKRLNQALNKPEAYNETITVAYARLVKSALREQPMWLSAHDFLDVHNHLLGDDDEYRALYQYYSPQALSSDQAREMFLDADLKPLPRVN